MTRFFLAGVEADSAGAEAAYSELRERSQIAVGCPATSRRIFKLDCRFEGSDCQIEVGRPLRRGGDVVVAILDHGREEPYVVHTRHGTHTPTRVSRPVYAVTDFC